MKTVVIADDEPITRMDVAGMLEELGFSVAGEAADGFDAVEQCRRVHPDVALLDVKMPVFDGLTAAETIIEEELAGCVVLLTAFDNPEIIERAKNVGVAGFMLKPVQQRLLLPTLEMAWAQGERFRQSKRETREAQRKLDEVRVIQKAQSILAEREGIAESEAYRILRKTAMDKRVSVIVIAQALLEQAQRESVTEQVKTKLMQQKGLDEQQAFQAIAGLARKLSISRQEAAQVLYDRMEGKTE